MTEILEKQELHQLSIQCSSRVQKNLIIGHLTVWEVTTELITSVDVRCQQVIGGESTSSDVEDDRYKSYSLDIHQLDYSVSFITFLYYLFPFLAATWL